MFKWFERTANSSEDPFSHLNRSAFAPERRSANASTFRLVGIAGIAMGAVIAAMVYAARV
jgi:hypothetical protein